MFSITRQNLYARLWLPSTLSFIGGYVALLSLSLFGVFVNCMTGNATRIGMAIHRLDCQFLTTISILLLCFITGAFIATFIFDRRGHVAGLIIESILLLAVALLPVSTLIKMYLAATAMGMQNAFSTCISWHCGKIRTTHITGPSTDIGIALARNDLDDLLVKTAGIAAYIIGVVSGMYLTFLGQAWAFSLAALTVLGTIFFEIVTNLKNMIKRYLANSKILAQYSA